MEGWTTMKDESVDSLVGERPSPPPRSRRPIAVCAALCAVACVLRFALRGCDVIAYILVLAAVLVALTYFAPAPAFKVAAGLTAVLALAVCVTEVPIVADARTDAGDDTRFLVVLGARVDPGGEPSFSLLWRLESALDFLESHPGALAVLSGGQGPDEDRPEARAMYDWLVARGVDPGRLIQEPRATNTRENLSYSFDLIRERGYDPSGCTAVVSSSYHLHRAKLLARQLGVEVAGVASHPGDPVVALNYYLREAPAIWKELLVGGA